MMVCSSRSWKNKFVPFPQPIDDSNLLKCLTSFCFNHFDKNVQMELLKSFSETDRRVCESFFHIVQSVGLNRVCEGDIGKGHRIFIPPETLKSKSDWERLQRSLSKQRK